MCVCVCVCVSTAFRTSGEGDRFSSTYVSYIRQVTIETPIDFL